MFTGIIEEIGTISGITHGAKSCTLKICADKIFTDLNIGDSVAVNGVCLTATKITPPYFDADVMAETMRKTAFSGLGKGSRVNLERAMQLGGRFGGHIVSGHIDSVATIIRKVREDNAVVITLSADSNLLRYIVYKGSVTLDGISLTVAGVTNSDFTVSIIPHTGASTTLLDKNVGDKINVECDIIGKYVEKFTAKKNDTITIDFLKENGF